MGFSSYQCLRCEHPMLAPRATNQTNSWMSDVVALFPNGSVHIGTYDGYGRVDGVDVGYPLEASCYHKACWEVSGKPEHSVPSPNASDQGWFFDEGDHDLPKPEVKSA